MDLYDWLLFLHVLAAFAGVAALVVLWGVVLATRGPSPAMDPPTAMSLGRTAGITVGATLGLVLLLGIWLAIEVDDYELWDGWILASIVLWLVGAVTGGKAGREFERGPEGRAGGIRFQAFNSVVLVVILILMIWKPGA
jgi:uncharacterized membrane protein